MKRIAVIFLFPFFAPLMAISTLAFAWMLATPYDPRDGTGPAGSDALGLYFMMLCAFVGGAAQVVIGIPFCLLLTRIQSKSIRLLSAAFVLIVGLTPFALSAPKTPAPLQEITFPVLVVLVCFGLGMWIPLRFLQPLATNRLVEVVDGKKII